MAWYGATTARRPANRGPFITIPGQPSAQRANDRRGPNRDWPEQFGRNILWSAVTRRSRGLPKENAVEFDVGS